MPIVDKYKDMGTIVMGKLESGKVAKNDTLMLMPNSVSKGGLASSYLPDPPRLSQNEDLKSVGLFFCKPNSPWEPLLTV